MASIELKQTLQTHLLDVAFNVIDTRFGDDPSCLFKGVSYEHEGKIWNIRIGFQKDVADKITGVFVRIYSSDHIYGYHFSERPSNKVFYKILRVSLDARGSAQTGDAGYPRNHNAENLDFLTILSSGIYKDNVENPITRISQERVDECAEFFRSCPGLLPQNIEIVDPLRPQIRPQNNNRVFFLMIAAAILLYILGYKILKDRATRSSQ